MKLAVIAVTGQGALLADRLEQALGQSVDIFVKDERNPLAHAATYDSLSQLITHIYSQYDGLVFIMAAGIVIRVIAPHITDKRHDPAVVVMDETAQFAISLLSGHIGGANELARKVAGAVGAAPVITTATDVNLLPAVDLLGAALGLRFDPFAKVKAINAAIANRLPVRYYLDDDLPDAIAYRCGGAERGIVFSSLEQISAACGETVIITDKLLPCPRDALFLRPPTLAVGIGCRRGTAADDILAALTDALKQISRSAASIAVIGTAEIKRDEVGLTEAARHLDVPVEYYSGDCLRQCAEQYELAFSEFVQTKIGVGNVCEAAALLASRQGKLLKAKSKYPGITVAVAGVRSASSASDREASPR